MVSAGTVLEREASDRRSDQHQPLAVDPLRDARLHVRAERESGQHDAGAALPSRVRAHASAASASSVSPTPSSNAPSLLPAPRKLKRTLA